MQTDSDWTPDDWVEPETLGEHGPRNTRKNLIVLRNDLAHLGALAWHVAPGQGWMLAVDVERVLAHLVRIGPAVRGLPIAEIQAALLGIGRAGNDDRGAGLLLQRASVLVHQHILATSSTPKASSGRPSGRPRTPQTKADQQARECRDQGLRPAQYIDQHDLTLRERTAFRAALGRLDKARKRQANADKSKGETEE